MRLYVVDVNVVVSGLMASILRSCYAECQRNAPCSAVSISLREKVRPARLAVVNNETKFALHAQNKRKSGISSELGEFCIEYEVSRFLLGEFCTEMRPLALCWASFFVEVPVLGPCWVRYFRPTGTAPRFWRRRGALHAGSGGGTPRSPCALCRPRVGPLCRAIPRCTVPHPFVCARGSLGC